MQEKSGLTQPMTIEGNKLLDFVVTVNDLDMKESLVRALNLARELKEIVLFIVLSLLLLTAISLLPKSPAPYVEGTDAASISTYTEQVSYTVMTS